MPGLQQKLQKCFCREASYLGTADLPTALSVDLYRDHKFAGPCVYLQWVPEGIDEKFHFGAR